MGKKIEDKIQKIEENICQWIDDEAKSLKDYLEKDICSIRSEVDNKNLDMDKKVERRIDSLREELKSGEEETGLVVASEEQGSSGWVRAVLDLKNKLHRETGCQSTVCTGGLQKRFQTFSSELISRTPCRYKADINLALANLPKSLNGSLSSQ